MSLRLSARAQQVVVVLVLLAGLGGLVFTVFLATTGNDETSNSLPESVDRLIPASGSEVLRQATVGVDVASGYDAYLVVNGTEIRTADDGLVRDSGSGTITFTPGEGRPVEALEPEQNCVIAMVWKTTEGEANAAPVSWCFDAS